MFPTVKYNSYYQKKNLTTRTAYIVLLLSEKKQSDQLHILCI